jgi:hypothetical protein
MSLNARQLAFAAAYAIDRNAARAARSAGYSANGAKVTACRLLTNPNLQAALAAKEAELAQKLEIDRAAVIGGMFEAIQTARIQGDAGQLIRGWIEVARLTGMDKPETSLRQPSTSTAALCAQYEALSDEELVAVIEGVGR